MEQAFLKIVLVYSVNRLFYVLLWQNISHTANVGHELAEHLIRKAALSVLIFIGYELLFADLLFIIRSVP